MRFLNIYLIFQRVNLCNTQTENCPNDAFNMLGAFGLSQGNDIILEFWDDEQDTSRYYYTTFRKLKDWVYDFENEMYEPFNCILSNYQG